MKKLSVVLGIAVLSLTMLSFVANGECQKSKERNEATVALAELQQVFYQWATGAKQNEPIVC